MSQDFPSSYDEVSAAQSVGYNHHTSSNARTMASSNPVAGAFGKAASLLPRRRPEQSGRPGRQASGEGRAARGGSSRASFSGDDYLGTGDPCRVCGRPVEPTMSRCPHCGSLRTPLYQQVPFWIAVVVLVLLVVLLTLAVNSCSTSTPATDATGGEESAANPDDPVAQDKSGLQASLDQARGYEEQTNLYGTYTAATMITLRSAMAEASAVLADEQATESQVASAQESLSAAIGALRECPTGYDGYSSLDYQTLANSAAVGMQSNSSGSGTVLSVTSGTDSTTISVAWNGDGNQVINVLYNDVTDVVGDIVEGANVTFAGTVTGQGAYGDATVPLLVADYLDVVVA